MWKYSISLVTATAAAAAAKSLQSCPTLNSLEFSRQEHWSGLPFPSPMHESEKWKGSRSVVSDPQRSHGLQPSRLLRPWDFPGKSTGVGCHCLLCRYTIRSAFSTLWFWAKTHSPIYSITFSLQRTSYEINLNCLPCLDKPKPSRMLLISNDLLWYYVTKSYSQGWYLK